MAAKRASSKQKRSKQNRAQRSALEARKKAANEPREDRRGSTTAPASKGTPATSSTVKDKASGGKSEPKQGFFAAARESRGPRPGDVPVDVETLEGSWFSKRLAVPGGRQVLTGAALTVVLSIFIVLQKFPPANDVDAKATLTFGERFGTWGYVLVGGVAVVMVFAAQMILSPQRRRIWIGCSFVVALAVVFGMLQYLFPVGFLTYAVWRAAKVEGTAPSARARRSAAKAEAAETDDSGDSGEPEG